MRLRKSLVLMILALASAPALSQDAKTVIADASRAMGLDGVNSLYYYGAGANFSLGQNNNANVPWPRIAVNDYTRAIDFSVPASRATWATYAVPVQGGAPALATPQQNITPTTPGGWAQQLEIWTTPWGFLKGAAANNASVKRETDQRQALPGRELGRAVQVTRRPGLQGGRLHQRGQPRREGEHLGRARHLRRHAGRVRVQLLSRQQRPEVSRPRSCRSAAAGRCSR